MSNFYSPAPQNAIKPAAKSAGQISADAASSIQTNQQLGAAKAFQDHLDRGYQAMVETLNEIPADMRPSIPDPGAYSDSEDKRVAWYSMVNDTIAKNKLLDQAQSPEASPDALATAAARAPLSAESQKLVGGEINRLDQRQQVSAIQKASGLFEKPAEPAGQAPEIPPIDPKTPAGRTLKIAVGRLQPHMDTITAASAAAGVPPQLTLAFLTQESAGNADSTSATGVKGLAQVTQGTFKDVAEKHPEAKLTDRTDPAQSITAGALYMGDLLKQFNGDVQAAVAAYNAGPTAIRAARAAYPDDWQAHLAEFVQAPKGMTKEDKAQETSNYISQVTKYYTTLGGKVPRQGPTQTEFNQALLKENPNAIVNPIAKEIKAGLKNDAYMDINAQKTAQAGVVQDRLMQKFKAEQDFKTYTKINNYNKQIEKVAPAVQSVLRIDDLVGGLDGDKPIPGFGLGVNSFKKFMMTDASPEARDMRIAFSNLFSDIGLATSGQNFTQAEMDRLETRLGAKAFQDASAFRAAIKQQRERLYQLVKNPWEALPDDVKKDMYDNGVTNPEMFGQFKSNLVDTSKNPVAAGTPAKQAASGIAAITTKSGRKFSIVKKGD